MSYQVEFLDHASFDALPYPGTDLALGVADPKTMKAFVRKTGIQAVDLFNAAHELEHLQDGHAGAHADHYRNGVYYKDMGQMLQTIGPALNFIPGIGQVASLGAEVGGGMLHNQQASQDAHKAAGQQQQAQNDMMSQFQSASQGNTPQVSQPNVVQSGPSAGGTAAGGPSGSGGLGNIQNQLYGNYSGRQQ